MQSRLQWLLGTLAATAALASIGVGLNGYLTASPRAAVPPARAPGTGNPQDADPLAPRLFDQSGQVRVHVAGAVKKPGVYTMPAWARVIDVVRKAGGPSSDADLDAINLADTLRDGEQVRIPVKGKPSDLQSHQPTPEPPPVSPSAGGQAGGRYPFRAAPAGSAEQASAAPVNLNSATREELEALPGIGPATAARIIAYREEQGRFLQPEDLMNVKGIGQARYEKLRPYISAP